MYFLDKVIHQFMFSLRHNCFTINYLLSKGKYYVSNILPPDYNEYKFIIFCEDKIGQTL